MADQANSHMAMEADLPKDILLNDSTHPTGNLPMPASRTNLHNINRFRTSSTLLTQWHLLARRHTLLDQALHPRKTHMAIHLSVASHSTRNTTHKKWAPQYTTRLLTPTIPHDILIPRSTPHHTIKVKLSFPNPTTLLPSTLKIRHRTDFNSNILVAKCRLHSMHRPHLVQLKAYTRHNKAISSLRGLDKGHTLRNNRLRLVTLRLEFLPHKALAQHRSSIKHISHNNSRNNRLDLRVEIRGDSIGKVDAAQMWMKRAEIS